MNSPLPARHRAQLVADDVSVTLGTRKIFTHLSLSLSPGDRVFVVGENGRGKTTLLNTLVGRILPDSGRITRHGSIAIADQQMPAGDGRTVGDAVRETIRPAEQALERLDDALITIESDPEEYEAALDVLTGRPATATGSLAVPDPTRIGRLSQESEDDAAPLSTGQRRRRDIARLLATGPAVLLLDEPTNHLSIDAVTRLTRALEETSAAVVLVTHDRQMLRDTAHWPRLKIRPWGAPPATPGGDSRR